MLMVLQMRETGYWAEFRPFGLDPILLLRRDEDEESPGRGTAARGSRAGTSATRPKGCSALEGMGEGCLGLVARCQAVKSTRPVDRPAREPGHSRPGQIYCDLPGTDRGRGDMACPGGPRHVLFLRTQGG